MKKIICSVCRKELSKKQYKRYEEQQKGLIFNWGTCQGKDAYPVVTTTDKIEKCCICGDKTEKVFQRYNYAKKKNVLICKSCNEMGLVILKC